MTRPSKSSKQSGARFARAQHPPPLPDIAETRTRRLRFIANAAFDGEISYANLLDSVLVAATATQGYQLYNTVRLIAVEMWHCPVASTVSTVSVIFDGQNTGLIGDLKIHSDSSMGLSPAHVRARPSPNCGAALMQATGASSAFRLTVPSGAVVDVTLEMRNEFNGTTAVGSALVGATAGAVYLRGLDGLPIATTVLVPAAPTAWCK